MFTIHLLGLPHTVTGDERFSHCAFTGKVERFAEMMSQRGYMVIHYGVGSAPGATNLPVMDEQEQCALLGHAHDDPTRLFGLDTDVSSPLYQRFNEQLGKMLRVSVSPGDIVALPFGHAHGAALGAWANECLLVETGIGYPTTLANTFHIYESEAWRNWHTGREQRQPSDYEWVIPNYYKVSDWPLGEAPERPLFVYAGRIQDDKGLQVIRALAAYRTDCEFFLFGQGDPVQYLSKNVQYGGVLRGPRRAAVFGQATALLAPSRYLEPFCGVAVEAMLCGTPVISSDSGAFVETNQYGLRCKTLKQWSDALDGAMSMRAGYRRMIQLGAQDRYSYNAVGRQYDAAFHQLSQLYDKGWFTT